MYHPFARVLNADEAIIGFNFPLPSRSDNNVVARTTGSLIPLRVTISSRFLPQATSKDRYRSLADVVADRGGFVATDCSLGQSASSESNRMHCDFYPRD